MITDVSGVSLYTLNVACGEGSTSVSGGTTWTDSSSYSQKQYVDVSDLGTHDTYFVLPIITLSNPGCPITNIRASDFGWNWSD